MTRKYILKSSNPLRKNFEQLKQQLIINKLCKMNIKNELIYVKSRIQIVA